MVSDPAREGALLDPLFLNKEGQVSDGMLGSNPEIRKSTEIKK